ncbi:conserved hypothetical protein [Culex quinquefasciatus]|uniref:Uncharacterized protein n=1 Tax=Culex quinquefasciatus TaxID=7176 RepID=B0W064_CULQU|nr:conserved hypothetical protein [Culex quinquefasciatus]|eukprot:XP_001842098.1 conserved hypothetical protein [Culex quinquefasciatus]
MDKSKKPPPTAGGTAGGTGAPGGKKPGGPGAAGKGPPKKPTSDSDAPGATTKAEADSGAGAAASGSTKEDATSAGANGDKKTDKADPEQPSQPSKPGSAGATVRDGAQKVLTLAMKSEWAPVEAVLKGLEKAVAAGGDDANLTPLAGVMDPCCQQRQVHDEGHLAEPSSCHLTSTNRLERGFLKGVVRKSGAKFMPLRVAT